MSRKYNMKNPAIRRIMADMRELAEHPSDLYKAFPLEEDMFQWHFTIRGPPDTPFEEGIYHGKILLPSEYPFKPPHIIMLTPNGRFQVGQKICLSISAYHPETWLPAWGVRTMLEAIISFFPSEGKGAIGALDWPDEDRRRLAKESHKFVCDLCGPVKDILKPYSRSQLQKSRKEFHGMVKATKEKENMKLEGKQATEKSKFEKKKKKNSSEPQSKYVMATDQNEHAMQRESASSSLHKRVVEIKRVVEKAKIQEKIPKKRPSNSTDVKGGWTGDSTSTVSLLIFILHDHL